MVFIASSIVALNFNSVKSFYRTVPADTAPRAEDTSTEGAIFAARARTKRASSIRAKFDAENTFLCDT
jgi:hypothetical protein